MLPWNLFLKLSKLSKDEIYVFSGMQPDSWVELFDIGRNAKDRNIWGDPTIGMSERVTHIDRRKIVDRLERDGWIEQDEIKKTHGGTTTHWSWTNKAIDILGPICPKANDLPWNRQ